MNDAGEIVNLRFRLGKLFICIFLQFLPYYLDIQSLKSVNFCINLF
jgi:hypothetical protein